MKQLERYVIAIFAGLVCTFTLAILLAAVIAFVLDLVIGTISQVMPVIIDQQTYNNGGIVILGLSAILSLAVCIPFTLYMARFLKDRTWNEIIENSMIE
ncbi:MAG: hypothetical protein NC238_00690 [Dehalobacter sp.]|nr:hypothetical protein [Dehalobacter sp.]